MPNRPAKWARVEPSKVTNRPGGGGSFDDVTGKDFTWTGFSYRQTNIVFDKPVDRIVVKTKRRGDPWPHAIKALNIVTLNDLRAEGIADLRKDDNGNVITNVTTLAIPHKAGTLTLYAGAGASSYLDFIDIFGEVAA